MSKQLDEIKWFQFDLRFFFTAQAVAAVTVALLNFTSLGLLVCIILAFPIVFFLDLPLLFGGGLCWMARRIIVRRSNLDDRQLD